MLHERIAIVPPGNSLTDYTPEALARERTMIAKHRARIAGIARKLRADIHKSPATRRKRQLRVLRAVVARCRDPQRMSCAVMNPTRAGLRGPFGQGMLRRVFRELSQLRRI